MVELRDVFGDLVRVEIRLWEAVDRRLQERVGLPLSQVEPLSVVARTAHCRVHDVADALGVGTGTVSKLVDRIEAAGHLRRDPNPEDRRSSLLVPTTSGRRVLRRAEAVMDEALTAELGGSLSARDVEALGRLLARLRTTS